MGKFAEELRVARARLNIGVREASVMASVSSATFSRVENGKEPSLTNYFKLKAWVDFVSNKVIKEPSSA